MVPSPAYFGHAEQQADGGAAARSTQFMRLWMRLLVLVGREIGAYQHEGKRNNLPERGQHLRTCGTILGIALITWLSGCASTQETTGPQPSGFLGEYAYLLRPTGEDHAGLLYRDPEVHWAAYRRILLEPVMIWGDPTTVPSSGQREDLQQLVDSFYHLLASKLSKDYALVDAPVSGTMRIQTAISYGKGVRKEPLLTSKVSSQAQEANSLWTFASSKPVFTDEVAMEFIVKDARTDNLLAAGIDRGGSGTTLFKTEKFNSWNAVRNGLEFWADASLYRLCLLRGGPHCIKPAQ